MKRREFLKASSAGLIGLLPLPLANHHLLKASSQGPAPDVVWVENGEPVQLVQTAVNAFGGMHQFVSRGDIVVVKPNIGFDRAPEYAATTHPDLVAEVIKLCLNAGAKKVKVFDRSANNARRSYANSQIEQKAKAVGAEVSHVRDHRFKNTRIREGEILKEWPIYQDYLEADKVINIPVAKQHNMSRITLGLKNLMGVLGGNRGTIHFRFDKKIIDINGEIPPTLTIIDAYRILTANGPSGGRLSDVKKLRTLVMSPCTVTADYVAASLFQLSPNSIGHIQEAIRRGLQKYDLNNLQLQKITLS